MRLRDISERWAVGSNQDRASPWALRQMKDRDHHVVWLNIRQAFGKTDDDFRLDPDHPTGGPNSIGRRVAQAKEFWGSGGHMNPSELSVKANGSIFWGDGRHRMVAAVQMGEEFGPVVMDTESLRNLKKTDIEHWLEWPVSS